MTRTKLKTNVAFQRSRIKPTVIQVHLDGSLRYPSHFASACAGPAPSSPLLPGARPLPLPLVPLLIPPGPVPIHPRIKRFTVSLGTAACLGPRFCVSPGVAESSTDVTDIVDGGSEDDLLDSVADAETGVGAGGCTPR